MTAQGERIGPAFRANPVIFLMGAPLLVSKESGLTGMTVEKTIEIIEGIKQLRSVAQGIEPY